jgi:hypothetical protein
MRRIFIIAATIALTAGAVWAQDTPDSEKGPNFPTPEHGPAYPAVPSNQPPDPSFGANAPAAEPRDVPQRALPEQPSYSGEQREIPAQPER